MKSVGRRSLLSGTALSATKGCLLAFASGLAYSFVSVFVKHIKNIHPAQLMFYRYCAVLSLNLPSMVLSGVNVLGPPGCRTAVFVRAFLGATAGLLGFFAFRFLPLGEAAVLVCSYPAFVTVAARIFLKEPFGILQVISVLSTIIGMILITGICEPMDGKSRVYINENIYGLAACLASVAFITGSFILMRKLKHVDASVMMFTSSIAFISESVVVTLLGGGFRLHYKGLQQLYMILIGLLSYVVSVTLTVATQCMEAGPVSTVKASTGIFFSFVWQVVIFGDIPSGLKIFGAALIGISIAIIGFHKRINEFFSSKFRKFTCNRGNII